MTQAKSTRAFRTISEAADELGLQSHVLRFWESKFPQIQPMKRSGGRRFYRPEDIEFLRGIKILLHREKHPIKDVQKLIRIRGAQSVIDLGRSVEQAAVPKAVKDTDLVPNIKPTIPPKEQPVPQSRPEHHPVPQDDEVVRRVSVDTDNQRPAPQPTVPEPIHDLPEPAPEPIVAKEVKPASVMDKKEQGADTQKLESALERLKRLKSRWHEFE